MEDKSDLIVNDIQRSFHLPYEAFTTGKPCVYPFITQFMPKAAIDPYDMAEQRRYMPIRIGVVVERVLGNRQFVVSASNTTTSFENSMLQFTCIFEKLKERDNNLHHVDDYEHAIKPVKSVRHLNAYYNYIYVGKEHVARARALGWTTGNMAVVRLVDENVIVTTPLDKLFEFSRDFCKGTSKFALSARITLPPSALTNALGLPDTSRVALDDRLVLIVLTSVEPHLAVVAGYAESVSHGLRPERLVHGLNDKEASHWAALFDGRPECRNSPVRKIDLFRGYPQSENNNFHNNRLALVVALRALDELYVRDLGQAVRLPFLQELLFSAYNRQLDETLIYKNAGDLRRGYGVVWLDKEKHLALRAEVVRLVDEKAVQLRAIDYPNRPLIIAQIESIFAPIAGIDIAPLVFSVPMAVHVPSAHYVHLTQLAACVIPDNTPVLLNSNSATGFVDVTCAAAPHGVLAMLGMTESDAAEPKPLDCNTSVLAPNAVLRQPMPERVDRYCDTAHGDSYMGYEQRRRERFGSTAC